MGKLTPHDEWHFSVKVAWRVGANAADVFPLISDLRAHDDQRWVHGGVAAFEAHTSRPRPKRCGEKERQGKKQGERQRRGIELKDRVGEDVTQKIKSSEFKTDLGVSFVTLSSMQTPAPLKFHLHFECLAHSLMRHASHSQVV